MAVRALAAVAALLTSISFLGAVEDRRTDKDPLSVMTIKTLFMWDGEDAEDGAGR